MLKYIQSPSILHVTPILNYAIVRRLYGAIHSVRRSLHLSSCTHGNHADRATVVSSTIDISNTPPPWVLSMQPPLSLELQSLLESYDGNMADTNEPSYHQDLAQSKEPATRLDSNSVIDDIAAPPAVLNGSTDPIYEAKARTLNSAIQEIGMGRYQWQLFVVVGFGWASDNLWPIVTAQILEPVSLEFNVPRPPLLTLAQNIGLLVGAMFWGFGCDIFGRRLAFNLTIGVTSVFGLLAASSPNFAAIGCFCALWSFGVGGNLPVGMFYR